MGIMSVSQGLQILGGYGYCDEFSLEQHYRDIRIHPIHEGTTGIQALDLLSRKVLINEGAAFTLFLEELSQTISDASGSAELQAYAERLDRAQGVLKQVTEHLVALSRSGDRERFLTDSTLYLEMFGIVAVAWQWLRQGVVIRKALSEDRSEQEAAFYHGKFQTMQFFFHYEMPKIEWISKRLFETDGLTAEAAVETFAD
jgi:butyryl-CoA dehydrogenase